MGSPSRRDRGANDNNSYTKHDFLGVNARNNDGRQDSSRSDNSAQNHRNKFKIEDSQPKSAFLLQHMTMQ